MTIVMLKQKNLGILTEKPKIAKYVIAKLKQILPIHAKCMCDCTI